MDVENNEVAYGATSTSYEGGEETRKQVKKTKPAAKKKGAVAFSPIDASVAQAVWNQTREVEGSELLDLVESVQSDHQYFLRTEDGDCAALLSMDAYGQLMRCFLKSKN